jgi:hypothetical protein
MRRSKENSITAKYKLTYFDIDGGRAEPIRIAFHAAGIEFEDHRISFDDYREMRSGARFACVPVLGIAIEKDNPFNKTFQQKPQTAKFLPNLALDLQKTKTDQITCQSCFQLFPW